MTVDPSISRVDHLVLAAPDLDAAVDEMEATFGLRATPGGSHPGEGTRNALYSLGQGRYLEVVGPDSEQPNPGQPRWFGIDQLTVPRLVTWAATAPDINAVESQAAAGGIRLGPIVSGGRTRPDGTELTWRLTDPRQVHFDGLVPFFIDWGSSPHPSASATIGLQLVQLRAEHPNHILVQRILDGLELPATVSRAAKPALIAVIESPHGILELR